MFLTLTDMCKILSNKDLKILSFLSHSSVLCCFLFVSFPCVLSLRWLVTGNSIANGFVRKASAQALIVKVGKLLS